MSAASSPATPAAPPSDGKLHILIIDPALRLADQAGSTRSADVARRLAQAGHRVSVLTTAAALKGDTATIAGVTVTAMASRARARFGFPLPPAVGGAYARGLLWRIWRIKEVDAVLATDRPLAMMPLLIWFCWKRGIPLLLDAREGAPPRLSPSTPFGKRLIAWGARGIFRLAARAAKQIVVISPDLEQNLRTQGIGRGKLTVSGPGCDSVLFATQPGSNAPAFSAYPYLAQRLVVIYAGQMTAAAELERVLGLAAAARAGGSDIIFALCGDGPARGALEARAVEMGVLNTNVWFLDPLARRDLPALVGAATAVIVTGRDFWGDNGADPAVFYDALAAGRPVVVATGGWQRETIEGRGAGLALPDGDINAAVRELTDFLQDSDGLRRIREQSTALAAGRYNIERSAGTIRTLIVDTVLVDPRAVVLRRRTLGIKRFVDVVVSGAALIILSPFLIALAIAVGIKMGWPVLFTQNRPGLKGRTFRIYKFRTMNSKKDASGALLPDGARLTDFGKTMRRFSLDELPQLINILKGDMSIIGPRPLLIEYMPYYTSEQHRRHDVKPGVTGWAQVNGRNAVSWEDKFAMDVWYVDNVSFWLDVKILFKTVWTVLTGHGVSQRGHATFERFDEIMARRQGAEDV